MIRAVACAKINLSLRVGTVTGDGLHRIDGIFQSISLADRLSLAPAETDVLHNGRGGEVIAGWDNLAWRGITEVRELAGRPRPVAAVLDKAIPAAAGLGGGSADAAAAIGAAGRTFGVVPSALPEVAARLGSDVPFCFHGGTVAVGGTGEVLQPMRDAAGYALAVVTPPIELPTGEIYATWDRLGSPRGPAIAPGAVPPSLRESTPLVNDLFPAAVAVAPALDDWRSELAQRWGRPVLLTGSGPTLFAFFIDESEAAAALEDTPPGARAKAAAVPLSFGWALSDDGELVASRPLSPAAAAIAESLLAAAK